MKSLPRRILSFAAIAAFVAAQAMLAAHAGDPMPSCHGGGDETVACASHCAHPVPTVGTGTLAACFVPGLATRFAPWQPHPRRAAIRDPALLHATSPPLAIRNCCFRI